MGANQYELGLEELLQDPIVQLVMRRDGVAPDDIRALVSRLRSQSDASTKAVGGERQNALERKPNHHD
ncbi:hypothetical protein [Sinorhizobium mexicanum]|uniref:Uncharacterized protein n=1 Tax=Sinorhizobium mexicanum TaxID=375549 RepID=A0A859QFX6_9HYPH|nr:hypothetical protein [Sinorhizobium mexicanum]MBP1887985.1 hypothetical protein [Sinorhizobium mexicanum]QLL60030.1 hypothetical protein FKV68_00545 [Sinorhizobium mexicanum]